LSRSRDGIDGHGAASIDDDSGAMLTAGSPGECAERSVCAGSVRLIGANTISQIRTASHPQCSRAIGSPKPLLQFRFMSRHNRGDCDGFCAWQVRKYVSDGFMRCGTGLDLAAAISMAPAETSVSDIDDEGLHRSSHSSGRIP
jgi:hypothetical protein